MFKKVQSKLLPFQKLTLGKISHAMPRVLIGGVALVTATILAKTQINIFKQFASA